MVGHKHKTIKIEYNGKWPALCHGFLRVKLGRGKWWDFGSTALTSGGAWREAEDREERDAYGYTTDKGPWHIYTWPHGFPEEAKKPVLEAINREIEWGCCGGCV